MIPLHSTTSPSVPGRIQTPQRIRSRLALAITCLLSLAMILPGGMAASASSSPYAEDPIGLVPFRDSVHAVYSGGEDVWEVWVCDVPGWEAPVEVNSVANQLNQTIAPYFLWLSDHRYRPVFTVGGTVTSADSISADRTRLRLPTLSGCEEAVESASSSSPNGVLIVADGGYGEGYGSSGYLCSPPFQGCSRTYPANSRRVVVGAGSVIPVEATRAHLTVVAHEIGHTLSWAHSYGGEILRLDGSVNEYDNIMDVMSGWELTGAPIATHAYNRYAAGWIDPWEVGVYAGGTQSFLMQPIGGDGYEMVVIPYAEGVTFTMGLRERSGWDDTIAAAGVEMYLVDSTSSACVPVEAWPEGYPCLGSKSRISPAIPPATTNDTTHVMAPGEAIYNSEWETSVVDDGLGNVYVRITDGRYQGRFVDDEGSPHEANIETIASLELTQGCDPPINDRFCPSALVTRAEMATFLVRAIGIDTSVWTYQGYFHDVPSTAWFAPYVETLRDLGVTTGYADGSFKPGDPVSRAEMAALLTRAFDLAMDQTALQPFGDVEPGAWYGAHATALLNHGITSGCSTDPLMYCPSDPVPREQMASFLARVLGW